MAQGILVRSVGSCVTLLQRGAMYSQLLSDDDRASGPSFGKAFYAVCAGIGFCVGVLVFSPRALQDTNAVELAAMPAARPGVLGRMVPSARLPAVSMQPRF